MGEVRVVRSAGESPLISVVIPSLDGIRQGNVQSLLGDLEEQTVQDFEVILSIGFKPNGHARNQGVKAARGRYLVCIDDDVRLGHAKVLEQLIAPFARFPEIGMTGPSQQIPRDSTPFQQRVAREMSRTECPIVSEITDSDFVSHMCLCIPTELYKSIGWESDDLPRGTDPDLRNRLRQGGYRIVVVPDCWAYHPVPGSLRQILRMAWRNGAGSAWVHKHHPEICFDTHDQHGSEAPQVRSRAYRGVRFAWRFLRKGLRLQYVGFLADLAYGAGYLYGLITGKDGLR